MKNYFFLASASLLLFGVNIRGQGSLIPPGPPGPTMKTLDQIEPRWPIGSLPFTITTPGVYYLTGNLTGVTNQDGITVSGTNVTIDLNGFSMTGASSSLAAIRGADSAQRLVVKNGTLTGWQAGIAAPTANHSVFEKLTLADISGTGLEAGAHVTVANCNAANSGDGFKLGATCNLTGCTATENARNGFTVGSNSTLSGCKASENGTVGIFGAYFVVLAGCQAFQNGSSGAALLDSAQLTDCHLSQNVGRGLSVLSGAKVVNCTAINNGSSGFDLGPSSQVEHSKATANSGSGFSFSTDAVASDCSADNNNDAGITTAAGAHISNCKASGNGIGFRLDAGCSIRGSTAQNNRSDGISVISECIVSGNFTRANFNARDAAGIHASGTDNCIQENNVVSNDRGIYVPTEGNSILRNTVTNNTLDYVLGDGQIMGPTVTKDTILDSANPWSNLTF